jgi:hypothetical protein
LHCCLLLPFVEAKVKPRYISYSYLLVLLLAYVHDFTKSMLALIHLSAPAALDSAVHGGSFTNSFDFANGGD